MAHSTRFERVTFALGGYRLIAYSEAGADCLYAPGVYELPDFARIVAAVRPKPVNVMISGPVPA